MTNDSIYEIWRPANSPWTQWVKPVVFPFLRPPAHERDDYVIQDWRIPLCADAAIIVDLPGAEGVSAGIAMARAGYRPVLVYNACPNADYCEMSEFGPQWRTDSGSPPVWSMRIAAGSPVNRAGSTIALLLQRPTFRVWTISGVIEFRE